MGRLQRLPEAPKDSHRPPRGFPYAPISLPWAPIDSHRLIPVTHAVCGSRWLSMAPDDSHRVSLLLNHYPEEWTAIVVAGCQRLRYMAWTGGLMDDSGHVLHGVDTYYVVDLVAARKGVYKTADFTVFYLGFC